MAEEKREKQYWLHRITGGENGKLLSYPLLHKHNILSIGWSAISSQEVASSIQERGVSAIIEAYEKRGATWSRNAYSLLNFVHHIHKDDIVIVPEGIFVSVYRIVDDNIITNDTLPQSFLDEAKIQRVGNSLFSSDGESIDLGFYRNVEPVVINVLRGNLDDRLYKKARALQTNINISDVSRGIDVVCRYL